MDPYRVLGLDKKASSREIKDAYRKLALENHPDKGGESGKFQKISDAYEILSDPQKKCQLDNPHPPKVDFRSFGVNFSGGGHAEPFGSFFRGMNTNVMNTNKQREKIKRTPDKRHEISLSLEEMYNGKTSKFAITRNVKCSSCEGEGGSGKFLKGCISCGGRGFRNVHSGRGVRTDQCMQCDSEGKRVAFTKACEKCETRGNTKERIVVDAIFPPGCPVGYKIVKKEMSDYKHGKQTGDIIIVSKQKEHPFFTRHGKNLKCSIELTFCESVVGFSKTIKHLDGRAIDIKCDEVVMNGQKIVIEKEGMIKNHGSIEVELKIKKPKKLSENSIIEIKKILESNEISVQA